MPSRKVRLTRSPLTATGLIRASGVVAATAMILLALLMLLDGDSSVIDRGVGALILVLVAGAIRRADSTFTSDRSPAWRPRDVWDILLPFAFPLFLGGTAAERGSGLQWVGWLLLALALGLQIAIWRLERPPTDGVARPGDQ